MMLKELVKDTSVYGFSDFIFKLLGFLTFPIYAFLLTLEDFSTMTLIGTIISLTSVFLNLGNINSAVQRFYWDEDLPDQKQRVVTTGLLSLLVSFVLFSTLFLFVALPFSEVLSSKYGFTSSSLLYAFGGGVLTNLFAYALNVIRLHFTPWRFFFLSMFLNAFTIIFSISFIYYLKMGIEGYFLGILIANILLTPVALWCIRRDFSYTFDLSLARKMLSFSLPFILMSIIYWMNASVDRWMLLELADKKEVGLYAVAFRFAMVINLLSAAFGQAFSPLALKTYSEKTSLFPEFMCQTFVSWTLCLALVWSLIALFAGDILRWITPEPYWTADRSLAYLSLGTAVLAISPITAFPITLSKKTHLFNYAAVFALGVNLVLNWLWIPQHGAVGAANASACSYLALTVSYGYISSSLPTRFSLDYKFLLSMALYVVITLSFLHTIPFSSGSWQSVSIKCVYMLFFALFALLTLNRQGINLPANFSFRRES